MGPSVIYLKFCRRYLGCLSQSKYSSLGPVSGSIIISSAKVRLFEILGVEIFIFNIAEIGAHFCGPDLTLKFISGKKCFLIQPKVLLWAIYPENMGSVDTLEHIDHPGVHLVPLCIS